jgi:hypothetical protein
MLTSRVGLGSEKEYVGDVQQKNWKIWPDLSSERAPHH